MSQNHFIQAYCHIKNQSVSLNGNTVFYNNEPEFSKFIKSATIHLETNYSKFYKMDNLSKLAFLAADILLKKNSLHSEKTENIAIILSNKASSLDTDIKHQISISDKNNYYPSPSIFVYTLPNICMGEISIKHQLHSENTFLIFDQFNAKHLHINADFLLKYNKADKVLCGWVDFDDNNYEAFLYLVSENGNIAHLPEEIERLYPHK
ncbi:MAG: 3-oxoacyl-ACP synthase [Aquaticitalea sp.]